MRLVQLEVEEGFLHGLKLRFVPGLNVLIGPRGVGKTSVIELVRFCLGVSAYTKENEHKAREHALSVLGSGVATLELEVGGSTLRLTRSAASPDPELDLPAQQMPIVLAQNEIERIGLDARGRLKLIDDFLPALGEVDAEERALLAQAVSITQDLRTSAESAARLHDEILAHENLDKELADATVAQEKALENFSQLQPDKLALDQLDANLAELQAREHAVTGAIYRVSQFTDALSRVNDQAGSLLPTWPPDAGTPNLLDRPRTQADQIKSQLAAASGESERLLGHLVKVLAEIREDQDATAAKSRVLRTRLEEVQAGTGALSHRITTLRTQLSSRAAAEQRRAEFLAKIETRQTERQEVLNRVDALRENRFGQRDRIVKELNRLLAPHVDLGITRYGQVSAYADAIAGALRGSNLRYGTLAPQLADQLTPRELVEAVERGSSEDLAEVARIAPERAARVIERLREAGVDDILRAPIEDAVSIALLDGSDYKSTSDLSTGQRCTAVLPILLSHDSRTVVIDQPEDHLDNAYIADTVVRTLRSLPSDSQLLVSTHNANIPVLGNAARVTLLGSDGHRGFVECDGELAKPEIVAAITRVMEGGADAFRRRASFYGDHPVT
jgi:hypothetical protein